MAVAFVLYVIVGSNGLQNLQKPIQFLLRRDFFHIEEK